MSRFALLLAAIATAGVAMLSTADARDGCGRGWYFNGHRCVPMRAARYYGAYAGPIRPVGSVRCNRYGECYRTAPHSCTHPGFTIQDGVCKPYRGY